ncbi:helix-turn-helix domain-containing protein [Sphingobium bisphenolivorans]|uniref:helix-turn-helix domain-containing protein n=1 Tax=Sphingobium bisphenolivorans TaxID=1335760 RepID=UPI0003A91488|nr:helix-turn-helix transcriptional regulator [Sphingobium bisphenolivorans]
MRKTTYNELQITQRELQILELIAYGFSAKEVAQAISIAPRTVEGHIDTIRLKLQARNRAHMVAKAVACGLVVLDGEEEAAAADAPQGDDAEDEQFLAFPYGTAPSADSDAVTLAQSG